MVYDNFMLFFAAASNPTSISQPMLECHHWLPELLRELRGCNLHDISEAPAGRLICRAVANTHLPKVDSPPPVRMALFGPSLCFGGCSGQRNAGAWSPPRRTHLFLSRGASSKSVPSLPQSTQIRCICRFDPSAKYVVSLYDRANFTSRQ